MNTGYRVFIVLGTVVLGGVATEEHVLRRIIERRYHESLEGRRQLELRVGEVLTTHAQVKQELQQERDRSTALSQELLAVRQHLEEAAGRLAEETRSARELQLRLAATQEQMTQLQGELALTQQDRQAASPSAGTAPVQLERVVVSSGDSVGLGGRVVSVHKDWNFVILDLGWDTVRAGDTVSILREGRVIAKARVDRVQQEICAATLLPGWETAEVHVNDLVKFL